MSLRMDTIVEALLLTATAPLSLRDLRSAFHPQPSPDEILRTLEGLRLRWDSRGGMQLVEVATGWLLQSRPDIATHLAKLVPPRSLLLRKAASEVLAVIVYRQPITRPEIEAVRGVVVKAETIHQLESLGWIEVIGTRRTPGFPSVYATTTRFLDDLGLRSLADLPPLPPTDLQLQIDAAMASRTDTPSESPA